MTLLTNETYETNLNVLKTLTRFDITNNNLWAILGGLDLFKTEQTREASCFNADFEAVKENPDMLRILRDPPHILSDEEWKFIYEKTISFAKYCQNSGRIWQNFFWPNFSGKLERRGHIACQRNHPQYR